MEAEKDGLKQRSLARQADAIKRREQAASRHLAGGNAAGGAAAGGGAEEGAADKDEMEGKPGGGHCDEMEGNLWVLAMGDACPDRGGCTGAQGCGRATPVPLPPLTLPSP